MYISVGQDTVVRTGDVVGVFDLDRTSVGRGTKTFLRAAEKSGRVIAATEDIPVSFVLCRDGRVVLSPFASATLRRKMQANGDFEEHS